MPLILSIVGYSNSGKTMLLEKVLPLLKAGGYSVGVIKHTSHGFSLDRPDKDSQRFSQAGAEGLALVGEGTIGFMGKIDETDPLLLDRLEQLFFQDKDFVLTEGFKKSDKPKIVVMTPGKEKELLAEIGGTVVATVGESPILDEVPHFTPEDPEGLVHFLEERYLKRIKKPPIRVILDGKNIPLNQFAQEIVCCGLLGVLSPLKGFQNPHQIEVRITSPGKEGAS
ncbi:MAG TPA: molybdopterin-guanine dinucleotide biosynthesis protein B [Thermodesulfobacteriota bacterium]|nr:molybdopterin-guanine dinucleotide biosynthesis protein B [Thermodesulfobacteriota bacterium]